MVARRDGLANAALQPGIRLRVDLHGGGTYVRVEKKTWRWNVHFIRFDGAEAEQPAQLKGLVPAAWSVLPHMPAYGGAGDRGGHGDDRTTRRCLARLDRGAARPGDRRGVAPELLRLIVNEQALDGKGSLLLPACGIGANEITRVRVVPQTAEQAAARRTAATSAAVGGGAIAEGQLLCGAAAAGAARPRQQSSSCRCSSVTM